MKSMAKKAAEPPITVDPIRLTLFDVFPLISIISIFDIGIFIELKFNVLSPIPVRVPLENNSSSYNLNLIVSPE